MLHWWPRLNQPLIGHTWFCDCVLINSILHTGPDPGFSVGGTWTHLGGGFGLQCGHFSVKMYAKTKELGPVGRRHAPLDPPMTHIKIATFISAHYLIGCQCLAIICLLCIIFIINIYHRKSSKPVPPYLRVLTNLSKKQPVKNVSFTAKQNNRKPSHRHLNIKTIHRNNLPGHLYLNGEIEQFEIDNDILDTLSSNETESGKCQRCHWFREV